MFILNESEVALVIEAIQVCINEVLDTEERMMPLLKRLQEPEVDIYACFNHECPGPGPDDNGMVYFATPLCPYCKQEGVKQQGKKRLSQVPRRQSKAEVEEYRRRR